MIPSDATYFTVVGSRDPHSSSGGAQGPGLDLLDALLAQGETITEVLVAWTPGETNEAWPGGYDAQKDALTAAVRERLPQVRIREVPLTASANRAADLLPLLAQPLSRFRHGGQLHANTSSGTPQMAEVLLSLRGTGWFGSGDVTLWQVDGPARRQVGQPFHREVRTSFLEEALRLEAAFAALRRFDFAGAQDAFAALAGQELGLPGRAQSVRVLAEVAEALYLADAREAAQAAQVLERLMLNVPAAAPIRELLTQAPGAEALIWLTWGRYDRARAQERRADALVWAVVLHELLVVKLAEHHGLPDTEESLRAAHLPAGLFQQLAQEVPALLSGNGHELKFRDLKQKLQLLRAASLNVAHLDVFDAGDRFNEPHPELALIRRWRNKVLHQGHVPDDVETELLDEVVNRLLRAFPFCWPHSVAWVHQPDDVPVSAQALQRLTADLQGWLG
jgi:hypothetical protein